MGLNRYTAWYESDGCVTKVHFSVPDDVPPKSVLMIGAGVLLIGDCCPGERWCVTRDTNDMGAPFGMPVAPPADCPHQHHYGSASTS